MKKKPEFLTVPVIVLTLCAVFLFAGCNKSETSILKPYDPNVPADQLCTLEIAGNIMVTKFDDTKVKWQMRIGYTNRNGSDKQAVIQIPAGTHEMLASFGMTYNSGSGSVSVKDVKVTNDFAAGRTYRLTATLTLADGKVEETWTGVANASNLPQYISFKIIDLGNTE